MNLLKETIEIIKENDKSEAAVLWCGTKEVWFHWDTFKILADVDYDSGFGSPKVAQDLIVVGKNWWLERHEYDGSEWWEFKQSPRKPKENDVPKRLVGGMWNTLAELNEC